MAFFAIRDKRIVIPSIALFGVILLTAYYIATTGYTRWDYTMMDAFFRIRGARNPGHDIVIVALDRESSRSMQRRAGSWQRSDYARAINLLSAAGADLIAIDIVFAMKDDDLLQDRALKEAMENAGNVILASNISMKDRAEPHEIFRQQEVGEGFINMFPDIDGSVRKMPPPYARTLPDKAIELHFPFSVQIAVSRLYPDSDFKIDFSKKNIFKIGALEIPRAGSQATDGFFVNYVGPSGTIPTISMHRILNEEFKSKDVAGKVVMIGNMDPFIHDYYPVPFKSDLERYTMRSMYGVEIHANAVHTLIKKRFIRPFASKYHYIGLFLFALFSPYIAIGLRGNAFLLYGLSIVALVALTWLCYRDFTLGVFIPPAAFHFVGALFPLVGLAARQADEVRQKHQITRLFGRYVAPGVVQELLKNPELVDLRGKKQLLTIFFSDIRGFTSLSEKIPAEEVSAILNRYFKSMTQLVFKHRGTLDKFMGDAVMAFFGNPVTFEDHASEAVEMSLEMRDALEALKKEWAAAGKDYPINIGIGINTGEVVVGNLGSEEFFDYTVIGDDVNLACRLESIAKGGQIIISESTYERVKDEFEINKLEPVRVKGKTQPVQIYEVISLKKFVPDPVEPAEPQTEKEPSAVE